MYKFKIMQIELNAELFEDAMVYAINKHRGQRRKGSGLPYVMHPFAVMRRIFANKQSKNMYLLGIAAICHDIIEDCYDTPEERALGLLEITKLFGPQVASIVDELTLDKDKYATIGKKEYLAAELNIMSSYALAIKLCDRLENVCDMIDMDSKFQKYYVAQTRYIISKLDRHLSPTHKNLIAQIEDECSKYELMLSA